MSLRAQLIRRIAELAEEDVRALLGLVERLQARHESVPTSELAPSLPGGAMLHPERFGTLLGSVQFLGDADAPVVDPEAWTFDAENVGS